MAPIGHFNFRNRNLGDRHECWKRTQCNASPRNRRAGVFPRDRVRGDSDTRTGRLARGRPGFRREPARRSPLRARSLHEPSVLRPLLRGPAMQRPPIPPFSRQTALEKVQAAEDAWNSCNQDRVAMAYSEDTIWRNREEFFEGRDAVRAFLRRKWATELHYRLMKELWCWTDKRISVRFEYEWQHARTGQWYRTHGNEHWQFNADGFMSRRDMSANDIPIAASERRIT